MTLRKKGEGYVEKGRLIPKVTVGKRASDQGGRHFALLSGWDAPGALRAGAYAPRSNLRPSLAMPTHLVGREAPSVAFSWLGVRAG